MSNYPYKFKTPEEVFAASEKRMEKKNEEIKAAIIAHLNVLEPAKLLPLYTLIRAMARKELPLTTTQVLNMIRLHQ